MKPFKTAILITLGIACMIPVAVGQESRSNLEAAKEKGRDQSRYLKETKSAQEASEGVPEANIAHYRKTVEPILQKSCVACHGAKKAKYIGWTGSGVTSWTIKKMLKTGTTYRVYAVFSENDHTENSKIKSNWVRVNF